MSNALREEFFKLTAAKRLELVEELWDSIATEWENEPFPLALAPAAEDDLHDAAALRRSYESR
jgi:hypothetical protein